MRNRGELLVIFAILAIIAALEWASILYPGSLPTTGSVQELVRPPATAGDHDRRPPWQTLTPLP